MVSISAVSGSYKSFLVNSLLASLSAEISPFLGVESGVMAHVDYSSIGIVADSDFFTRIVALDCLGFISLGLILF